MSLRRNRKYTLNDGDAIYNYVTGGNELYPPSFYVAADNLCPGSLFRDMFAISSYIRIGNAEEEVKVMLLMCGDLSSV